MNGSEIEERLLANRIAEFSKGAPSDIVARVNSEIERLIQEGVGSSAARAGESAPLFELPDACGDRVALAELLKRGPAVVTFYRGGWCPYCNAQLHAYEQILPRITALGASLVAISPQTPAESWSTAQKRELSFSVLSDSGNEVARRFGLVFRLSELLSALNRHFGIDLEKCNGDRSNELPVPGTFIVAPDGHITFRHVDVDWRRRLEPRELLRRLEI